MKNSTTIYIYNKIACPWGGHDHAPAVAGPTIAVYFDYFPFEESRGTPHSALLCNASSTELLRQSKRQGPSPTTEAVKIIDKNR